MMKILELGKFYPPHRGGIETLLQSWCEGFVSKDAQVDCVVANDEARTVSEIVRQVNVHRLASYGMLFSTSFCPGYLRATRKFSADLWHSHFPNPLADLTCLAGRAGVPLVISYHSDIVRQASLMQWYGILLHRLLKRATRIVVATPAHIEHSKWLGGYKHKCAVIPFGIDLSRFDLNTRDRQEAAELRQRSCGSTILLNIGRLVGYKGQRYLLEAARHLDADVWLVGTGPLESDLKNIAAECGLGERVRFWGSVDDRQVAILLQACDIFVLPSITPNEAFGLVQVEAMASGKPVICCDLPSGVPFVNQHGVTGFVIPPAHVQALADAVRKLTNDSELRSRMGAAGKLRAQNEFSDAVMISRYWELFSKLSSPGNAVA